MQAREIKERFIKFFQNRGHEVMPSASLIPKDASSLLTIAGMQPFKKYFTGEEKPPAKRLVNIQKSFRTVDIEKVGYNRRTLTFFFMLGSWSIGDYYKEEAIKYAWELLTDKKQGFGLDPAKLWATVFEGSEDFPRDEESVKAWQAAGLSKDKIVALSTEHNVWVSGPTGPRGVSTEVYYDRGEKFGCGQKNCKPGCDCDRFLEIWNAGVFMSHEKMQDGSLRELPFKSVDTGAGLERIAAVLQNQEGVFEIDIFKPIIEKIEKLSGKRYGEDESVDRSFRIIADHYRGAVFLIGDGVEPEKEGRGYILRRILRRAIWHGKSLGIKETDLIKLIPVVTDLYQDWFSEPKEHEAETKKIIAAETNRFLATLDKGLKIVEKQGTNGLDGALIFDLYATYGLPTDLVLDLSKSQNIKLAKDWRKVFDGKVKEHQNISRAGAEKKFGGAGKLGEKVARQHTATHLLQQALRDVLGNQVKQRGSDLTEERLRFDFSYDRKMTPEQIKKVEDIVNSKIKADLPVVMKEMSREEAAKIGAIGLFDEKYGDKVKVYSIGDYSREYCAGPHVKRTGELGHFKIKKEESSSSGVRRIKAVLD